MTPQTIVQVDFAEIASFEIACNCGGVLTIPLPKDQLPKRLNCPNCNTPLWNDVKDKPYLRAAGIAESISEWKRMKHDGFRLRFSLPEGRAKQ
jgi:hypothetical protein